MKDRNDILQRYITNWEVLLVGDFGRIFLEINTNLNKFIMIDSKSTNPSSLKYIKQIQGQIHTLKDIFTMAPAPVKPPKFYQESSFPFSSVEFKGGGSTLADILINTAWFLTDANIYEFIGKHGAIWINNALEKKKESAQKSKDSSEILKFEAAISDYSNRFYNPLTKKTAPILKELTRCRDNIIQKYIVEAKFPLSREQREEMVENINDVNNLELTPIKKIPLDHINQTQEQIQAFTEKLDETYIANVNLKIYELNKQLASKNEEKRLLLENRSIQTSIERQRMEQREQLVEQHNQLVVQSISKDAENQQLRQQIAKLFHETQIAYQRSNKLQPENIRLQNIATFIKDQYL